MCTSFRLLGHLYAAEALVLLDNIVEAMDHLNPDNVKDVSCALPEEPGLEEEVLVQTAPPTSKAFVTFSVLDVHVLPSAVALFTLLQFGLN